MNKKYFHLSLFLAFFLLPASVCFAFPTKNQECTKCHTLKKDEASALLKNFDPDVKVLSVKRGAVKYLWEVEIESKNKKALIYIDLPKKHIISGSVIQVQGKKNLTRDRLSEINRVDASRIPVGDALVLGNRNAKKRIIVFDDPE
ncbi:MAG: hypothetical protein AB1442_02885 [Nitrospirota bacterium]